MFKFKNTEFARHQAMIDQMLDNLNKSVDKESKNTLINKLDLLLQQEKYYLTSLEEHLKCVKEGGSVYTYSIFDDIFYKNNVQQYLTAKDKELAQIKESFFCTAVESSDNSQLSGTHGLEFDNTSKSE